MSFMERLDSPLSVLVALLWLAVFCTIFAKLLIYHFLMMMMIMTTTVQLTPHYKVVKAKNQ